MRRLITGYIRARIFQKRLVAAMNGDQKVLTHEAGDLASQSQKIIGTGRSTVIKTAYDHEKGVADFFNFWEVFGIETVLHRSAVKLEAICNPAENFRRRISDVPPVGYRLSNFIVFRNAQRFASSNAARRTPAISIR